MLSKLINKIKKYSICQILLFLLTTCCFKVTQTYSLVLILLVTSFMFYKIYRNQLSISVFFNTYFSLLIYSAVFTTSVFKIYLILIILFFIYLYFSKKRLINKSDIFIEKHLLLFFIIILINHLLFKPYFKGLDIYIHFLLIPLLYIGIKKFDFKIAVATTLKIFIVSIIIVSILLTVICFFGNKPIVGINTYFAEPLGMTHVYYGLFLGTAISFMLQLNLNKDYLINRNIDLLITLLFISLLVYIGARMALGASCLILIIFIYKRISIKTYKKVIISILIAFSAIAIGNKSLRVQKGVDEVKLLYASVKENDKKNLIENSWKNMYTRYLVINYTLKEIKDSLFLGIGLQNVQKKISDKILKDGYIYFLKVNTHNQYLHFLVALGLLAFLYFIWLLILLYKNNNYSTLFLIFMLLIMLTESILVRQKGISIFLIFSILLTINKKYTID